MLVKVGVIGAGSMGTNHLRVLTQFDESHVSIVGVAEPNDIVRARAAKAFHLPTYADYRQLIDEQRPDLIAIVAPTSAHFEIAAYAISHSVHVLIEKPITQTVQEAETLCRMARARGIHVAVGYLERFNPAVRELKRHLESGELGEIFALHSSRLGPFPPRIRDVGVVLDLATHDLDVMRYLLGSEALQVYACTRCIVHQQYEDIFHGVIGFPHQILGALDVNWLTPTKVRELSITGEYGMYMLNYLSQELYFYENDYGEAPSAAHLPFAGVSEGVMTRLKVQRAEPLRLEYEDIFYALEHDTETTVTAEDGLAAVYLAQLLQESSRLGVVLPTKQAAAALVPA